MNTDMVAAALETWDLLPLPPETYRYVFAKRITPMSPGYNTVGTWINGPGALLRFMQNHSEWDCYITLNPVGRRDRIRPKAKDVSHLQAILIDIDPITDDPSPLAATDRVTDWLRGEGVPEDSVTTIDSGRGMQLWIHINPLPIIGTGSLQAYVRSFTKAAADWLEEFYPQLDCRVDTSCSDLARLARLPGTINQKTQKAASITTSGTQVPALWLLSRDPSDALVEAIATPETSVPRVFWPDIAAVINRTAYEFIMEGQEEPGRHKACFATAMSLKEACVEPGFALELLFTGSGRSTPHLPIMEVERIWRQVNDS